MTRNESKNSQTSGSSGLESKTPPRSGAEIAGSGVVRLRSLLDGGGFHPNTHVDIPTAGEIFEVQQWQAIDLLSRGLAEQLKKEGE